MAQSFKAEAGLDTLLLTDPKLESYVALGLKRSMASVASLGSIKSALRAFKGGHRQTNLAGDPWQLGGALLIDPEGTIQYRYASQHPGDHPPTEALLAAARELAAQRGGA